jgi:myb proto-oncogene protein
MRQRWTGEEDTKLCRLVLFHDRDWAAIANHFPGRDRHQIATRWTKCLDPELTKGSFTKEEDAAIVKWASDHGGKEWSGLRSILPNRTTKQCRERWRNRLDPRVVKSQWTPQEDQIISELHSQWGNNWSRIAMLLPGRTDDAVKNRWNGSIVKKAVRDCFSITPSSAARMIAQVRPQEEPEIVLEGRFDDGDIDEYELALVSELTLE